MGPLREGRQLRFESLFPPGGAAAQLVINALRMRPDRIVVGEVHGEEALDMLQAMNTGHDGSLTTIHANSPRDAISRLETMSLMANLNLPEKAVRRQAASAISIVVQISRMSDGTRRVTHFTEITGMDEDVVSMQDIFNVREAGHRARRQGARAFPRYRDTAEVRGKVEGFRNYASRVAVRLFGRGVAVRSGRTSPVE